jgi:hypothetical protein
LAVGTKGGFLSGHCLGSSGSRGHLGCYGGLLRLLHRGQSGGFRSPSGCLRIIRDGIAPGVLGGSGLCCGLRGRRLCGSDLSLRGLRICLRGSY